MSCHFNTPAQSRVDNGKLKCLVANIYRAKKMEVDHAMFKNTNWESDFLIL